MGGTISFSHMENEFLHDFRDKVGKAENVIDLGNAFSYTVSSLIKKAVGDELDINIADVIFSPGEKELYSLSPKLKDTPLFAETIKNSDLKNIIDKFAETASHRYIHMKKHPEKTNLKIK